MVKFRAQCKMSSKVTLITSHSHSIPIFLFPPPVLTHTIVSVQHRGSSKRRFMCAVPYARRIVEKLSENKNEMHLTEARSRLIALNIQTWDLVGELWREYQTLLICRDPTATWLVNRNDNCFNFFGPLSVKLVLFDINSYSMHRICEQCAPQKKNIQCLCLSSRNGWKIYWWNIEL